VTELVDELPDRANALKHGPFASLPVEAQVEDYDMTGLSLNVDKVIN
jgi:hypothetical protein